MKNLDLFIDSLKSKLPEICTDKDLVKCLPDIFRNQCNLTRMRARKQTPPYIHVPPHFHYLKNDVLCWLREKYND